MWNLSKSAEKQAGRNKRNQQQQSRGSDGVVSRMQHSICVGQQIHTCCLEDRGRHKGLRKVRYGEKRIRPGVLTPVTCCIIFKERHCRKVCHGVGDS